MPDLKKLAVSLTKNGYFKIAQVIKRHPRNEILDNISGVYVGINLNQSQIAAILSSAPDGQLPQFWDDVREAGDNSVDGLVMISILFSHHLLINAFADSFHSHDPFRIHRVDLGGKVYTNLLYSMKTAGLCNQDIPNGTQSFTFDLSPLFSLPIASYARQVLHTKLLATGWLPPDSGSDLDDSLYDQCINFRFHSALGLTDQQFRTWLTGDEVRQDGTLPEEVRVPSKFIEGASRLISVNIYERNPKARRACIVHYGYTCQICNFDFENIYGEIGREYIHVHHLLPLSRINTTYEIDPITDLIPVCPNCHAMLHRFSTLTTPEELRNQIKNSE